MRTTDEQYRKAARAEYADDILEDGNTLGVDEDAEVKCVSGGAWVAAWVYIYDDDVSGEATEPGEGDGP